MSQCTSHLDFFALVFVWCSVPVILLPWKLGTLVNLRCCRLLRSKAAHHGWLLNGHWSFFMCGLFHMCCQRHDQIFMKLLTKTLKLFLNVYDLWGCQHHQVRCAVICEILIRLFYYNIKHHVNIMHRCWQSVHQILEMVHPWCNRFRWRKAHGNKLAPSSPSCTVDTPRRWWKCGRYCMSEGTSRFQEYATQWWIQTCLNAVTLVIEMLTYCFHNSTVGCFCMGTIIYDWNLIGSSCFEQCVHYPTA